MRPADPNGPEERIALRRQSAWLAAAFVFLFVFMMVVWMNDVSRAVIFWMWVVGTVGIFILSVRLWLALVREDEKKAKRIRDRDVRYRKPLALLPEGVAILGEGWRIDWVNARGAEHFGIAPEMIGRSFSMSSPMNVCVTGSLSAILPGAAITPRRRGWILTSLWWRRTLAT